MKAQPRRGLPTADIVYASVSVNTDSHNLSIENLSGYLLRLRNLDLMKLLIANLLNDEQGQDLIEYTLLMAFVALASAALFLGAGGSIAGIWTTTNTQLAAANTSAS